MGSNTIVFSPLLLKKYILRDRLGVVPMTSMLSRAHNTPLQNVLNFLGRGREHGAVLVYADANGTDNEHDNASRQSR